MQYGISQLENRCLETWKLALRDLFVPTRQPPTHIRSFWNIWPYHMTSWSFADDSEAFMLCCQWLKLLESVSCCATRWGLCLRSRVLQTRCTGHSILWDAITYPCPRYLVLLYASPHNNAEGRVLQTRCTGHSILWDAITYPCPRYLVLLYASPHNNAEGRGLQAIHVPKVHHHLYSISKIRKHLDKPSAENMIYSEATSHCSNCLYGTKGYSVSQWHGFILSVFIAIAL